MVPQPTPMPILTAVVTFSVEMSQQQSFVDSITKLTQIEQNSPACVSIQFFSTPMQPLSARELDVLKLVVEGCSNPEIAKTLHVSHNTVKTHLRNLMNKFGVDRRVQLVTIAMAQRQPL